MEYKNQEYTIKRTDNGAILVASIELVDYQLSLGEREVVEQINHGMHKLLDVESGFNMTNDDYYEKSIPIADLFEPISSTNTNGNRVVAVAEPAVSVLDEIFTFQKTPGDKAVQFVADGEKCAKHNLTRKIWRNLEDRNVWMTHSPRQHKTLGTWCREENLSRERVKEILNAA